MRFFYRARTGDRKIMQSSLVKFWDFKNFLLFNCARFEECIYDKQSVYIIFLCKLISMHKLSNRYATASYCNKNIFDQIETRIVDM